MTFTTSKMEFSHMGARDSEGRERALLCVNPGIPAGQALEEGSCILAGAISALTAMAMETEMEYTETVWMIVRTVETAKAIIDSVSVGICASEVESSNNISVRGGKKNG